MRSLIHVGLAALLVVAPALCCCTVRNLTGLALAHLVTDLPASAVTGDACCHTVKPARTAKKAGCCQATDSEKPESANKPQPTAPKQDRCQVCEDRLEAIPPEIAQLATGPGSTGELMPIDNHWLPGLPIESQNLIGGPDPTGWVGGDSRYNSLFLRHVLRC